MHSFKKIFPLLVILPAVAISTASPIKLQLRGSDTFDSCEVNDRELRLWRSSSAEYKILEIAGDKNEATFQFNGKGGAIGRISRISHRRSVNHSVVMSGSLTGIDRKAGKYLWGVYGWVLDKPKWDEANVRHEIYIIQSINRNETDPLIGTLDVGGKVYNMHRYRFSGGGYRFKAVAQQLSAPTAVATVDLSPFLNYWKNNGLGDSRYLHEVSWAVELLTSGEHTGALTLRWQ